METVRTSRQAAPAAMLAIVGLALLVAPSLVRAEGGSSLTGNLELRKGDHICLIGNTLADRMQHDGWLETLPPQPLSRARARRSATSASPATS